MFYKNYMNHTFEKYHYDTHFICKKCNMKIKYYYFNNNYRTINRYSPYQSKVVSCDEYIIKSIIE